MTDVPTDTGAALLAACRAHPEEDTPRLMYADFLEGEYVLPDCPQCKGHPEQVYEMRQCRDGIYRNAWGTCDTCKGTGKVKDDRAQRAELIRVQVELSRRGDYVPPADLVEIAEGGRLYSEMAAKILAAGRMEYAKQTGTLKAHAANLVSAHPHWLPACPVCEGGKWDRGIAIGPGNNACPNSCSGTGRIGALTRGFLESLPVRWEWVAEHDVYPGAPSWTGKWRPTQWARDLAAAHPLLVRMPLIELRPYHNGYGWSWFDAGRQRKSGAVPPAAELVRPLFDSLLRVSQSDGWQWVSKRGSIKLVDGRFLSFESTDDALDSLALAVAAWVRRAGSPAGA